jgi:1,4-dihydroxy-2-naphthoyl-CoA hydrolase
MAQFDPAEITRRWKGTLGETLGIRIVEASPDKVVAEMDVRPEVTTVGGTVHGGTLMAFADSVGATGAVLNLPPGAGTTTLESKTNFFSGCREGTIRATAIPLHRGRRTSVWETRVTGPDGKLLSMTIQTQMVLEPK